MVQLYFSLVQFESLLKSWRNIVVLRMFLHIWLFKPKLETKPSNSPLQCSSHYTPYPSHPQLGELLGTFDLVRYIESTIERWQ